MQITSNAVGGSAHFLSDHAEQAQHDATNSPESALLRQGIIIVGGAPAAEDKGKGVAGPTESLTLNFGQVSLAYAQQKANGTGVNPEPPATTSNSMASFIPAGGLHAVAGDLPTTTAKEGEGKGLSGTIHDVVSRVIGGGGSTTDQLRQFGDKLNEVAHRQ
jgi:hypothetical protein